MALTGSGAISLNEMHIEAGGSSGTACTINDSDIRGLIDKSSGATMSFNEWYGASANLASGGTESDSGGYHIHTFTSTGNLVVSTAGSFEILIVAGGGGGGSCRAVRKSAKGGGGGAGGILHGTSTFNTGTYTMTVGAAGSGGASEQFSGTYYVCSDGGDSSIAQGTWGTATALGGAHGSENVDWYDDSGATAPYTAGLNGGNGGGGGYEGYNETGEDGQASPGVQGDSNSLTGVGHNDGVNIAQIYYGGGGGGGGGDGNAGTSANSQGGSGYAHSISGSSVTYAEGGNADGGGQYGYADGTDGTTNRGNGGDGSGVGYSFNNNIAGNDANNLDGAGTHSGNGGSGIIIVRYQ